MDLRSAMQRPNGQREATSSSLLRNVGRHEWPGAVPAAVHDTLGSPGEPLHAPLRSQFESGFGHNFSQVRLHRDARAARSADAVNAVAYTVGRDIVFAKGAYAPQQNEGRDLLAHELTHVVDQDRGVSTGTLQRQARPRPPSVDENAAAIIAQAQECSPPRSECAVAIVRAIINQYFPGDASKISEIRYTAGEEGLKTTYRGRGEATTGSVEVGDTFVRQTDQRNFARRVLQVRHEIEHVEQVRSGMGGEERSDEREFIAHYHGAVATEVPGTGRVPHSTRVAMIDTALGYYYCLDADLQRTNASRRDELIAARPPHVRRSHNTFDPAPTTCTRPANDPGPRRTRGGRAQGDGGLSGGAIAGIVLGAVAGATAIGLGVAAGLGAFS